MNFGVVFTSIVLVGWILSGAYIYTCKYKMLCDELASGKIESPKQETITEKPVVVQDTTLIVAPKDTLEDPQGKFSTKEIDILKTTQTVYFKTGSTEMIETKEGTAYLNLLKTYLDTYPNSTITLIGHTDNVGTDEINLDIGKKRAENVKLQLVKRGIKASQILTDSKGSSLPIADNSTEEVRYKNRRTEITFIKK
ncbi:MAG: OmpA family protein [Thermoflexibacter sp.]|jgi:outer membrane protein OmpA-like peptidoglycan-associated protein|nr:OmpA family protein [Thermoflexibacter sp.]